MRITPIRRALVAVMAGIAMAAGGWAALGAPAFAADANANFVGHWSDGSGGWVILTQSPSGACTGTSDYGTGYSLTACQVTGNTYVFDIDYGSSYVSHNSGTITGNTATGSFHDSNGAGASYTATRQGVDNTATAVSCSASSTGLFDCTATVTDTTTAGTVPTGTVTITTTGGTVSPCVLTGGGCSFTYTPTAASNSHTTTLNAAFTSDTTMTASSAQAVIDPIVLTGKTKTVNTYLAGHGNSIFNLKLSRPSNVPVTVHVKTQDGTGKYAAHGYDGDYHAINETVTFKPTVLSRDVTVKVYPKIDIRRDANFSLKLSAPDGAGFTASSSTPAAASASRDAAQAGRLRPMEQTSSKTIKETINPDLIAGDIEEVAVIGHPKRAGHLWIRRYNQKNFIIAKRGMKVYVGDEIYTEKDSVAAVHFVLGGEVGINAHTKVTVTDHRSVRHGDGGILSIISHKITIWKNVSNEKSEKLLIQTNGGVLGGIKG